MDSFDDQVLRQKQQSDEPQSTIIPRSVFRGMLDQLVSNRASPSKPTWKTKRLCGRLLSLRRLETRLTEAIITEQTGLDSETLLHLELGLANPEHIPLPNLDKLFILLAYSRSDAEWIATIASLALGQSNRNEEYIVDRVKREIRTFLIKKRYGDQKKE